MRARNQHPQPGSIALGTIGAAIGLIVAGISIGSFVTYTQLNDKILLDLIDQLNEKVIVLEKHLALAGSPMTGRKSNEIEPAAFPAAFYASDNQEVEFVASWSDSIERDAVETPTQNDPTHGWGDDILLDEYEDKNGKKEAVVPTSGFRSASWYFSNLKKGKYIVSITYSSGDSRPLKLLVNGVVRLGKVADDPTGGFEEGYRKTLNFGVIDILTNDGKLTLKTVGKLQAFPHFHEMKLKYIHGD